MTPPSPPSQPSTPTVSNITSSSATLTMSLPAANGAPITDTGFWLYDAASGGSVVWWHGNPSPVTSVTATGLSPNQDLWLEVKAQNSAGWSAASARQKFTTLPLAPSAPSGLTATRNSDSQCTLTWTRNATSAAPYDLQRVQWRIDGGSWITITTSISGSATSYTVTGLSTGHRYNFQIAATNSAGTSSYHRIGIQSDISTTPIQVTGVTASKQSSGSIITSGTYNGGSTWGVTYEVQDNPGNAGWTTLASNLSSLSYTHFSPANNVTHQYRWRAVYNLNGTDPSDSILYGPWSSASGVIQLLAPPNAPSLGTAFNPSITASRRGGTLDRDRDIRLPFTHQPVDTTPQSAAEVRWRIGSGSWSTISLTTETYATVSAPGLSGTFQWQVRTRGSYENFGEWSAIQSMPIAVAPVATISSPVSDEVLSTSALSVAWSYFNGDSSAQSRYSLVLSGDQSGSYSEFSAQTSLDIPDRLGNSGSFTLSLEVQAANGLWSDVDSVSFSTSFLAPAKGVITGSWDRSSGSVVLDVAADPVDTYGTPVYSWTGTANASASIETINGTEIRRNLAVNPRQVAGTDGRESFVRWSWVRSWITDADAPGGIDTAVRVTCPSDQTGGGRGFDWYINMDTSNYTYENAKTIRVTAGVPQHVRCLLRASYDVTMEFVARIHDGVSGWLTAQIKLDEARLVPGEWIELSGTLTPTHDGYLAVSPRTISGSFSPAGATLDQTGLYIGDGHYFDGSTTSLTSVHVTSVSGEVTAVERNLYPDPRCASLYIGKLVPGGGSTSSIGDGFGVLDTSYKVTTDGASAFGFRFLFDNYKPNTTYRISFFMRASEATSDGNVYIEPRANAGMAGNAGTREYLTLYETVTEYVFTLTTHPTAYASSNSGFTIVVNASAFPTGSGFAEITKVLVQEVPANGIYFDSTTPDTTEVQSTNIQRYTDGQWVTIQTGLDPTTSTTDPIPPLEAPRYRAITYSSEGIATEGEPITLAWEHNKCPIFVNTGDSWSQVVTAIAQTVDMTAKRESQINHWAGVELPSTIYGDAVDTSLIVSATLADQLGTSTEAEWRAAALYPGDACYRDCQGHRVFGDLSLDSISLNRQVRKLKFKVDETSTTDEVQP